MSSNQLPVGTHVRRLRISVWWLVAIGTLLVGALLILAVSQNTPVRPIASHSSLRGRFTGLRSEHFTTAGQSLPDDLRVYPTVLTNFASIDDTNKFERTLERDRQTFTLPINPATKRVLEYLRSQPTVPTAPNAGL